MIKTKTLVKVGDEYFITIQGHRYKVFPAIRARVKLNQDYTSLKGQSLYLRVYPRPYYIFENEKPKEQVLGFQLFSWETQNNNFPIENNSFVIRGIWQFIPQSRRPVITVYRNHDAKDPFNRYKSTHLPVLMKRTDCTPYRFNPSADKDEKPQRWFIQAKFSLVTRYDSFGFTEDLEPPTLTIPRYRKPVKQINDKSKK